ncbi:Glycosyl transferase [Tenacibaculum sp. 190130A14a]|uniref:Glycosyl transferase n=1 Tax=Tenacibaculum polynesiense TaxID=3137857 RepID=A0ABM9PD37_9FLAO
MRVLQIINSLNTGGAEKLLLETIPLYVERGIKMDILLLWDNNCMFTEKLKALDCCKVYVINENKSARSIYNPLNIFKIAKIIKNYDLAHVHLFPAQYFTVFANIFTGSKCKLIFTEHNTSNRRINNKIFKSIEKYIYSKYVKLVCISDEIKNIYQEYLSFKEDKIAMINNGVYLEGIYNAVPLKKNQLNTSLKEEDVVIVQVSAFRPQKDQKTLIKAIKELDDKYKLLLVGGGTTMDEHISLVKELKLEERVYFLGQRDDVNRILKSADLVVLSSFYEGLSLASIEGLASGNPFIASDVPGLREIVKNYGVLFERGNVQELVDKISELTENQDLNKRVTTSCQERAKHFDIKLMLDKHINLYQKVYEG